MKEAMISAYDARVALPDMVPGLADAIRKGTAVDIGLPGVRPDNDDVGEAIVVSVQETNGGRDPLEGLSSKQDFLLARDLLQYVKDYRGLLRSAFEKLAVGGWLVITVPHQFLRERKFMRPSRHEDALGVSIQRFYTPGSLLLEVQEALDPTEYRVRLLKDDDQGFDYGTPIDRLPPGNKRIVLALQRIARPGWADEMKRADDPRQPTSVPERVRLIEPESPTRQYVVASSSPLIDSILVLKLDHRGDYNMGRQAMGELRGLYPTAKLTMVCCSWNRGSAIDSGLFDEVLVFDFVSEDPSAGEPQMSIVDADTKLGAIIGDRRFALAIDLTYDEKSRPLLERIPARHKAGLDRWNRFRFLDIKLSVPSPTSEAAAIQGLMPPGRFSTRKGVHKMYAIDFAAKRAPSHLEEVIIWGPYQAFVAGEYDLEFFLDSFDDEQELGFDICHRGGSITLFGGVLSVGKREYSTIRLKLIEDVSDLEIRFFSNNNGPLNFRFLGIGYRRDGAITGIHQVELGHLLVHLTGARLRHPFLPKMFPS